MQRLLHSLSKGLINNYLLLAATGSHTPNYNGPGKRSLVPVDLMVANHKLARRALAWRLKPGHVNTRALLPRGTSAKKGGDFCQTKLWSPFF